MLAAVEAAAVDVAALAAAFLAVIIWSTLTAYIRKIKTINNKRHLDIRDIHFRAFSMFTALLCDRIYCDFPKHSIT